QDLTDQSNLDERSENLEVEEKDGSINHQSIKIKSDSESNDNPDDPEENSEKESRDVDVSEESKNTFDDEERKEKQESSSESDIVDTFALSKKFKEQYNV